MARTKVKRIAPGFHEIKKALNLRPRTIAHQIAARMAPELTAMARASWDAGMTAYSTPRKRGVHGALDLIDSGDTRAQLKFEAVGTVTRCVLGTPYAKYLIGRYAVLPNGNAAVPVAWMRRIRAITADVLAAVNVRRAA